MFNFFGGKKEEKEESSKTLSAEETLGENEESKNFFSIGIDALKKTFSNTSKALVENVVDTVKDEAEFSDFVLEDMEDTLIRADLGVNYAGELVDKLRKQDRIKPSEVKNYLKSEFLTT